VIVNLKEYAHPNWESNIPCTMLDQRIPRPYKNKKHIAFKFTQKNLEDIFFNASKTFSWFTKEGIFHTILFYPNQFKNVSPAIKETKGLIYLFFNAEIPFGFFPKIYI